jgi:hypothetical protein
MQVQDVFRAGDEAGLPLVGGDKAIEALPQVAQGQSLAGMAGQQRQVKIQQGPRLTLGGGG